jgi:hypothetical protein
MKSAAIAKCWTFVSSKGDRRYQTLLHTNDTTSCDCPGWCKRTAADGSRSCKHTRVVAMGTADRECERMHDYGAAVTTPVAATMPVARAIERFGQIGRRKIQT